MTEPELSDFALIGNCRSAALVCKTGSIDWCCLPEFHSPAVFASILDRERGGSFSIAPAEEFTSAQRYLPDTNVAETLFETAQGCIRLTDAFSVPDEGERKRNLFPEHEILRVVEGVSGNVRLRMKYAPGVFYGKQAPRLQHRGGLGIHFSREEHIYTLLSTLDPEQIVLNSKRNIAEAEFSVKAGERILFSLAYSGRNPAVLPELKVSGLKRMEDTILFWEKWIGKCRYSGMYEEHVRRSALVLKLLAHSPSGAIIAAPTASLPEDPGGVRNWDYRYCWLRDASFTVNALLALGFEEEVHAYMNWILHATRLTRPRLQVVYSVYGHASLKEQSLEWLRGYRNSRPVRIGNGADGQFQLDLYGEVLDAVYAYSKLVPQFDRSTRKFILGLGKAICELWDKPDNGIWEVRSSCIHHTHSKVMAYTGLDRLVKLSEKYGWKDAPREKYRELAAHIRSQVEASGYSEDLKSYTRALNGNTLDASLLTFSLVGYCDYTSSRMTSTCEAIRDRLEESNMIYRYRDTDDGLPGEEGSFGVCSFWLAENLARSGKLQEAVEVFEEMLKHAGSTGLLSEEIDPHTGRLLGNYPQGFTHIGLISAALAIDEVQKKGVRAG